MANATTDITDSNGRINNNLPKRIFRESAENKNLLAKAGSLYYGTGETEEVTITLADKSTQTYQIPITKAVEPPIGGIKNDAVYGIKFVYNTTTAYKGMYWFSGNGTSYELYYMAGSSPVRESDTLVANYDGDDGTWNWAASDYQTATLSFAAQAVSKGFYNYVAQYMVMA